VRSARGSTLIQLALDVAFGKPLFGIR